MTFTNQRDGDDHDGGCQGQLVAHTVVAVPSASGGGLRTAGDAGAGVEGVGCSRVTHRPRGVAPGETWGEVGHAVTAAHLGKYSTRGREYAGHAA
jgi:hypothetical protein